LGVRRNASAASPIRLAIVDNDHSQMNLLRQRLQAMAWPHRMLGSPVPPDTLAAMRLDAVVLDMAALGPHGWSYLEQVCDRLPHLGVLVHTERATVAQRVRALRLGADDWVTKPCHAEELIARVEAVVRRRRRSNEIASEPVMIGELALVPGEYQATVGDTALELTRREFELLELLAAGAGKVHARGDLRAGVGLRHGAWRPIGRRLRAQASTEARKRIARLALRAHALRCRVPLRGRTGRGRCTGNRERHGICAHRFDDGAPAR
jgi:DNA-binding response OmpR family regulator